MVKATIYKVELEIVDMDRQRIDKLLVTRLVEPPPPEGTTD